MDRKIPSDPQFHTIYQILVPLAEGPGFFSHAYRIDQAEAVKLANKIGDGIVIPHLVVHMTEAMAWRLGVDLIAPTASQNKNEDAGPDGPGILG